MPEPSDAPEPFEAGEVLRAACLAMAVLNDALVDSGVLEGREFACKLLAMAQFSGASGDDRVAEALAFMADAIEGGRLAGGAER